MHDTEARTDADERGSLAQRQVHRRAPCAAADGTRCNPTPLAMGPGALPGKYVDGKCVVDHEATAAQIDANAEMAEIAVDLLCEYDTDAMAIGAAGMASEKWAKYGLKIARVGRALTIVGAASEVIVCPVVDAFD